MAGPHQSLAATRSGFHTGPLMAKLLVWSHSPARSWHHAATDLPWDRLLAVRWRVVQTAEHQAPSLLVRGPEGNCGRTVTRLHASACFTEENQHCDPLEGCIAAWQLLAELRGSLKSFHCFLTPKFSLTPVNQEARLFYSPSPSVTLDSYSSLSTI